MKLDFTPYFHPLPIPLIACVAKVAAENRGRDKHLGDKCGNKAKIKIDGKPYCLRHAQQTALNILIKERIAEIQP